MRPVAEEALECELVEQRLILRGQLDGKEAHQRAREGGRRATRIGGGPGLLLVSRRLHRHREMVGAGCEVGQLVERGEHHLWQPLREARQREFESGGGRREVHLDARVEQLLLQRAHLLVRHADQHARRDAPESGVRRVRQVELEPEVGHRHAETHIERMPRARARIGGEQHRHRDGPSCGVVRRRSAWLHRLRQWLRGGLRRGLLGDGDHLQPLLRWIVGVDARFRQLRLELGRRRRVASTLLLCE